MTRQVAMGAVVGFLVTVVLTTVWPRATPPPASGAVDVINLVPAGQAALPSVAHPTRVLRRPTRFVSPQHAMPVARP